MPGDFFAEDYNVTLFVGVLSCLFFMMAGCFVYHKWKHVKSKNKVYVPKKSKRRLRKFFRQSNAASDKQRDQDNKTMQKEADASNMEEFDNPVFVDDNALGGDDDVFRNAKSQSASGSELHVNSTASKSNDYVIHL